MNAALVGPRRPCGRRPSSRPGHECRPLSSGLLVEDGDAEGEGDGLAARGVGGCGRDAACAGPEWRRGALSF
jgi:hypothetical protein